MAQQENELRELSQLRANQESTLSLYLDLDPSEFATLPARSSAVRSLLDHAHRTIEQAERSHVERQTLAAALERARGELEGEGDWAQGARAVALFVDETLPLWKLLKLDRAVETTVVVGRAPFIAPLVELGPEDRLCVVLVDERLARVLRGREHSLREAISFGDDVPGRQEQGGWSQARYQRSRVEDVKSHLKHVAGVLERQFRTAPFDRLLIAAAEPLWPQARTELSHDLQARLGERVVLDVSDATIEAVGEAVGEVLAREHLAREDELIGELIARAARPGDETVATGLQAVLHALVERRVEALLFDAHKRLPGLRCPRDGWIGVTGSSCPVEGDEVEELEDVLAAASEAALAQSAEVFALDRRPELGPFGGVAAILRF